MIHVTIKRNEDFCSNWNWYLRKIRPCSWETGKFYSLEKIASLDAIVNSLLRKILFRSVNREPLVKVFDRKTDDFLPGQLAFTARWIATSYCWRWVRVWLCCFQCSLFRVEKGPQASILTRDNSQKVGVFLFVYWRRGRIYLGRFFLCLLQSSVGLEGRQIHVNPTRIQPTTMKLQSLLVFGLFFIAENLANDPDSS